MNKIKEMREELGWSRAKFCREFGIPIRTVENWDSELHNTYPPKWAEKLIVEKLEERIKENKKND